MKKALLLGFLVLFAIPANAQLPAFPEAQGGGALSVGGRGGVVIEVTNLNDSGTGSLRACATASGARNCIFRTGGTIVLSSVINITNPFLTIAGQTAPGSGIQITNDGSITEDLIRVSTHDVVIRYLRSRAQNPYTLASNFTILLGINSAAVDVYNVVFDHNSMAYGIWDNSGAFCTTNVIRNITFQYNIQGEPSYRRNHAVSTNIRCNSVSEANLMTDIDWHHNYLTGADHRSPYLGSASGRLISNLVYNPAYYTMKGGANKDFISNYIKAGPYTASPVVPIQAYPAAGAAESSNFATSFYISGNAADQNSFNPAANQWTGTLTGMAVNEDNSDTVTTPLSTSFQRLTPLTAVGVAITVDPAGTLNTSGGVLLPVYPNSLGKPGVGDSVKLNDSSCGTGGWLANRDTLDARYVSEFLANTGHSGQIQDPGTLPTSSAGTACTETLHDGIPDAWKTANGLSTSNSSLYSSTAPNGYTYLESYMNVIPLGADIYFAQAAAGAGTGASCATARAISSHVIGDDVAGNTLHLCGTIISTVSLLANGSSGNPITVLFEPGAKVSSTVCSFSTGCINTNSHTFITINGDASNGRQGIVENTANGTLLANQATSAGIRAQGANTIIKNLTIRNLYVKTSNMDGILGSGGVHGNGGAGDVIGIYALGADNALIDNVSIDLAGWSLNMGSNNYEVKNSSFTNNDHGVADGSFTGPTSGAKIHNNTFGDMVTWDTAAGATGCAPGNCYHHDGVHFFSENGVHTGPMIYNNTFSGAMGNNTTAWIFMEGSTSPAQGIHNDLIFNNTFIDTGAYGKQQIWIEARGQSVGTGVYNNFAYVGNTGSGTACYLRDEAAINFKNNICIGGFGNVFTQGASFNSTLVNNNVYADLNTQFGRTNGFVYNGSFQANLSGWKTACGCDAASVMGTTTAINANLTTGVLSSPSIAISAGANLTSLGIAALNADKNGVARPSSGAWDAGALNSGVVTPPPAPPPVLISAVVQ